MSSTAPSMARRAIISARANPTTPSFSISACPRWTAFRCLKRGAAPAAPCRCLSSPRATAGATRCRALTPAPTIMSPSRFIWRKCWRACARYCAVPPGTPRASSPAARFASIPAPAASPSTAIRSSSPRTNTGYCPISCTIPAASCRAPNWSSISTTRTSIATPTRSRSSSAASAKNSAYLLTPPDAR
jgi:hypothetical protein